jgi:hypothetical protein
VLFIANNETCLRTGLAPAEVAGEYRPGDASENTLSVELDPLSDGFRDDASETLFLRRGDSAELPTLS